MRSRLRRRGPRFHAIREVFADRDLRRVELAFAGFNVAEWGTWIAILVYAYDAGGAAAAGFVAVIQLVPGALLAPVAAVLGDRYRRERVLLLGYVLQAGSMAATAAALLLEAPIPVVYVLAVIAATAITMTRPTHNALLPSLSGTPEMLIAANVASTTVEGVCVLAGPALTGLLLHLSGPGIVFVVMATGVGISVLLVLGIRPSTAGLGSSGLSAHALASEALEGFRSIVFESRPRLLLVLAGAQMIVWGALDVLIVVMGIELLRMGESAVGYLNSALGAGGLAGAVVTLALVGRRRLTPALGLGIILWGAAIAASGAAPSLVPALALLALAGAGRSLMDVAGRTLLQRVVPDEVLSRVFGLLEGLVTAGLAIGATVAPFLIASLGVRGALVVAGAFLPVVSLLFWNRLVQADRSAEVPERELALLAFHPIFAPLPAPVLERLAGRTTRLLVPAGTIVIREGDAGDRFYLVDDGEVEVSVVGRAERVRLGPGEGFGEIALLRDVPRTATVTAVADVELLALEREDFLEAVTGHRRSVDMAEAMVDLRSHSWDETERRS
ncbi:MAG TPA: MFS transporter [Actinomycetota bacterium]|nr:MFS transporter [Actinomycetota bacterium]